MIILLCNRLFFHLILICHHLQAVIIDFMPPYKIKQTFICSGYVKISSSKITHYTVSFYHTYTKQLLLIHMLDEGSDIEILYNRLSSQGVKFHK